jgi:hypothetical protein
MNNTCKKECAISSKSLKCKPCKKVIKMNSKELKKQIKQLKLKKPYKMSIKTENKILKQTKKCRTCKHKNIKKCNLKQYMVYSGAEMI